MKFFSLCIILCLSFLQSFSQDDYYLWDKNWKPTTNYGKAGYFGRIKRLGPTRWQFDVYNYTGPLIYSEQLNNLESKTLEGRQRYYGSNGMLDSAGLITEGHRQGDWQYYNDSGKLMFTKSYDKGILISTVKAKEQSKADSLAENPGENESSFPGGLPKWQKYITKHLSYPERAMKAGVMGTASVQFIITTEGEVEDPEIFQSVEFSIDEAALALIKASPRWNPASRDGVPVKSYKIQPLLFSFRP